MTGQPEKSAYLSKSRLISAEQCPKKLFLEVNQPELGNITAKMEAAFATGREVGAIAQSLYAAKYGKGNGYEIPYDQDLSEALSDTEMRLRDGLTAPLFEATFKHDGVLVRVDVLLPDGDGYKMVEVKASTKVKDYHKTDCAIQYWVLTQLGLKINAIALAYVDNRFEYQGNGDYNGLLIEEDMTDDVQRLQTKLPSLINKARSALESEPSTPVGPHCKKPFECQFYEHCWPSQAEYPVMALGGKGKSSEKIIEWIIDGVKDIREVPKASLASDHHKRIHAATSTGQPEVKRQGLDQLKELPYPRYYLDFESVAPAVPIWERCRPYSAVPVQYSCHIESEPETDGIGPLTHVEFLQLDSELPVRALAEQMIRDLGKAGPILMYTDYEKKMIKEMIRWCPDLEGELEALNDRLVDLYPIMKENYYHPDMLGSWSIKAVVPTMNADLNYASLDGINQGTGAALGYLEAIHPDTAPERKKELEQQLRRYCKFDTEAMVDIVRFFYEHFE